jgi:hypothetical protein
LPVCFFATGSQRPANRPATRAISSVRTTPCYQKLMLYPRQYTCTIKGIFDGRIVQGTVGPVVASDELDRKWKSAHRERGKTWKNA